MAINSMMQKLSELSLYEKYKVDHKDICNIMNQEQTEIVIDSYCVECKQHSTFKLVNVERQLPFDAKGTSYPDSTSPCYAFLKKLIPFFYLHFECSRDKSHYIGMMLYFDYYDNDGVIIMKIGQYPSLADIQSPDYSKFSKCISNDRLKEIKKAIGLNAHGVGVGAFIYLRRVIEHLVNDACERAKEEGKVVEGKMLEKISSLQGYLPDSLIENKEAYSILSKGIHELSDDECLESFSLMKTLVDLILEEKNNERKQKEVKKGVSKKHSELKPTKK